MKSGSGCPDPNRPPSEGKGVAHAGDISRVPNRTGPPGGGSYVHYLLIYHYFIHNFRLMEYACFGTSFGKMAGAGKSAVRRKRRE